SGDRPSAGRATTFAVVAGDWFRDKLPGERKGKEVERDVRKEGPCGYGNRPAARQSANDSSSDRIRPPELTAISNADAKAWHQDIKQLVALPGLGLAIEHQVSIFQLLFSARGYCLRRARP